MWGDNYDIPYRTAIANAVDGLFGRHIDIDERAYQALSVVRWDGRSAQPHDVWLNATALFPGADSLHESLGIPRYRPPRRQQFTFAGDEDDDPEVWRATVVMTLFHHRGAGRSVQPTRPTRSAQIVAETGRLTIDAIMTGALEATRESGSGGPHRSRTTLVARRLAGSAGLGGDHTTLQGPTLRFVEQCVASFRALRLADSDLGEQQFAVFVEEGRVSVRPFGTGGAVELAGARRRELGSFRTNTVQSSSQFGTGAITELERLLNSDAREREFQMLFESYPELLTALGPYVDVHPQVVLSRADAGPLIPDFFLERLNTRFCDLCELKRADVDLVRRQQNRTRFRDAVMEAVAQLDTYRDWFEQEGRRDALLEEFGLTAFRPQAVLVIGRKNSFASDLERISNESKLPGWIRLTTYDDVLERARRWRGIRSA